MNLHDLIGLVGVLLIAGTYLGLQLEKIEPRGLPYSLLNAVGASLVLISLASEFNLSAALIEGFWLLISLVGLVRWLRRRTASRNKRASSAD